MKRIYSTQRPPIEQKSYADWITKCDQKLSISTRGLVAFTSSYCLNQSRPNSISHHVYVVDLNAPYQPYLIVTSEHRFTLIEWDPSGTKLLTCDVHGTVTIYVSRDYLVSDWKPYFKHSFSAEHFLTAAWYHPGITSSINVANQSLKSSANHLEYTEKIQHSKFGASLRLFGGKAAEGCLLVSRTGLVCCITLMADGNVDVLAESLTPLRTNIGVADISYNKDGSFVVGASSGSINSTISFYRVQLSLKSMKLDEVDSYSDTKRVNVVCSQYYSFHLNIMSQMFKERENCTFDRVNHIKFVSQGSSNEIIIETSGKNLSLIELWELEPKKKAPIHKAILDLKGLSNAPRSEENGSIKSSDTFKEWTFKGNYITDKQLVTLQVPRFKIFNSSVHLNIILLAYADSSICCLRKEDLQPIDEALNLGTSSTTNYINNRLGHPSETLDSKRVACKIYGTAKPISKLMNGNKYSLPNTITNIQLTANQTAFVAIDTMSQLHLVKLPPQIACQDSKDEEAYLQYLLEYCLVTGSDWWDVMVCTKQELIDTICDRFHDAFERQPKHIQRKYFNRQLMIRASLYRCQNISSSLCKSSDCYTMIMLNSIASTLKSMLRSQDQDSPAEYLSNFLKTQGTQANFFNCNNVLSKINEKELYVENDLIQSLQPLNQWITDCAIYLISSLLQRSKSQTPTRTTPVMLPGAGLLQNKEALEVLRELLIIIKIWGQQNEASLPIVYRLNNQIDVLGSLFRLISICYANLSNPDQVLEAPLLEECVQFTNSISISQFSFVLAATGIASPLLHNAMLQPKTQLSFPAPGMAPNLISTSHLTLEFFQKPATPELAPLERVEGSIDLQGTRKMDVVRNISLGAYPVTNVRHCTRCNSVSLIKPAFNTTRIWEQRWMTTCVCGGSWAQSSGVSASKVNHLASSHNNHPTQQQQQSHHQHHPAGGQTVVGTHHHLVGNHQLVR